MVLILAIGAVLLPSVTPDDPRLQFAAEHTAGSLDTTFDEDGIAIAEISSAVEVADSRRRRLLLRHPHRTGTHGDSHLISEEEPT